MLIWNK